MKPDRYSFDDICKIFSDKVGKLINEGWTINCNTMAGSQGELAKIHLISPDNKILRNIIVENISTSEADSTHITTRDYSTSDKNYLSSDTWCTVWNSEGTVIEDIIFYDFSRRGTARFKSCYTTDFAAYKKALDKRYARYKVKDDPMVSKRLLHSSEIKKTALKILRQKPKCKSKQLKDIDYVYKVVYNDGRRGYVVQLVDEYHGRVLKQFS